ncbi:hypothetical protein B9057_15030 (plasmid) [Aestuarium zhoushanense]|nr:hypothetical protein B9057_15030 [Aestuarium zhoushanense]
MRNLLGSAFTYLAGNIIVAGVPFLLLPIMTRELTPSEFGEVALFQMYLTVIIALTGLSIDGATGRKYFDKGVNELEMNEFIVSAIQLVGLFTIILLILTFTLGDLIEKLFELQKKWLYMAALTAFATIMIRVRLNQWQIRNMPVPYISLQAILSFLNFALSIIMVIIWLRGAAGRIEAQIASASAIALLAAHSLSKSGLSWRPIWRPNYIREILKFGVPLIPHVLGTFLIFSFDRLIVTKEMGLAETGKYMVAVQLSMVVTLIFDGINKAYAPWLYANLSNDEQEQRLSSSQNTYKVFAVIFVMALVAFLTVPHITKWIVGEEFRGAGESAKFLVSGQMINGMYQMVSNYLLFHRLTRTISLITIATGVIHVLLIILLVPIWGAVGASVTFFATMAVRFFITWLIALHLNAMPKYRNYF